MLKLSSIEVAGFGPFADPQLLEFPDKPGVTVIYGENMRGKTSLLNAIRFAFFGEILNRAAQATKIHSLSNRELAQQGQFGFSVSLGFEHNGSSYELLRECRPRVARPQSDADYEPDMLLRRDSAIVSPDECDKTLQQVFPSEVSRFFLFDGELLREYEELLSSESDTARKISLAIERILGVPILRRAKAHLSLLSDDADRQAGIAATRNQKTEAIGNALKAATEQKQAHQKELTRLEGEHKALVQQRAELERYLLSVKKYASILDERDRAVVRREQAETEEIATVGDLQRAMIDAWRTLLTSHVQRAREVAQQEAEEQVHNLTLDLRRRAASDGHCEVCLQKLDSKVRKALRDSLGKTNGQANSLSHAIVRLANLNKFQEKDIRGEVSQLAKRLRDLRLEQAALADQIAEQNAELSQSDPETLRRNQRSYAEVIEGLTNLAQGIKETQKKIDEEDQNIQRHNKKLASMGVLDLEASQRRTAVLRAASEVFGAAVDRYKGDLRQRVEASASKLFLAMTTEKKDYAALTINENYGLTIRHRDGVAEEARSAGAEHVVALALMGALQQNAPLRGPIVMDSPFGRLDEKHTSNVVQALPKMAEQVVLLVYEAEVGRSKMRELLGPQLRREYELEYVSARRTNVRLVR